MNLKSQRRLAAQLLGVGEGRIHIEPTKAKEVSEAITRDDIRHHISKGVIRAKPERGTSRIRAKHREERRKRGRGRGPGKRKGSKGKKAGKKERWVKKVRALRDELRKLREEGLDAQTFRKLYKLIKGNYFRSRRHLREHMKKLA